MYIKHTISEEYIIMQFTITAVNNFDVLACFGYSPWVTILTIIILK